jgi:hypothetical protein
MPQMASCTTLKAAVKQPPPPPSPKPSDTAIATGTTSTSSSGTSATATQYSYCISTRSGTDIRQFEAFIKSLPDAGNGEKIVYPSIDFQVYVTSLTATDLVVVKENLIVDFVVDNSPLEECECSAV